MKAFDYQHLGCLRRNRLLSRWRSGFAWFMGLIFTGILVPGQTVVDKTVATVSNGVRTELITLSDLKWQIALQPGVPIENPSSADLNAALELLINQRLFALEAERLPRNPPTADKINKKIAEIVAYFPSPAEFERRLKAVGFTSIRDDNFEHIISQRVAIDEYLDFRFRSFIVITPEDEARYYRDVFAPDFRRKYPGLLMPTLDARRKEINKILEEQRVERQMETFLEEARRRADVVILSPV